MKASETNLQSIIEGTKQYIIPMFQRTYSWNEKQWKQLWEDILDLIEDEQSTSHFIGSIVSIPVNANTHGVQQFLVIDGQQRMTTLLILLAAIRDTAEKQVDKNLSDEIHHTLLINGFKSGEEKYKFLPTQVDKEHFKRILNKEPLDGIKDSLIVKAYEYFVKKLNEVAESLTTIKNTLTTNLAIVSIVLSTEDNPYLVFESLNAKGQPLTQADLIRNYLFMRIPADDQDDYYNRYWLPIQEELGEYLTEFVRHFLLGININVKKNDVYVKFKEKIDGQDVKEFLKKIANLASYYAKLLYPDKEDNKDIRNLLKRINDFEAKTAYPFLLYIYHDYKKGKYDEKQFRNILTIIENFLVRRFVCNVDSKALNKIFASLYNQISTHESEDSLSELMGYLQNRGYPKDPEVKSSLKENHLYGQGDRRKKGAFILKIIENSYSHKEKANLSKATIEHIMPQTLTEKWIEELGENAEYVHSVYLHTLGNLTLSAYNTELSNEPFSVKRKYYKDSNIFLNKKISEFEKWNQINIEERANVLINKFLEIWPYFGKPENEMKKVTGSSPRLLIIHQQSYPVNTWREVMEKTIMAIYEQDIKKYKKLMEKNSGFLSMDGIEMRAAKKLPNGHYLEANLSAKAIYNFCLKIFEEAGYNRDDWQVEIEHK
ncbi:DUF262 domain-containing protein [Desertibacillus haloalkaliphilus]|uniref:DUF262 domain-containing protein n=1 Tax=Desertibacillus haloalkaliphilus TaxID=1328930 RepID=UPI001C2529C1|nr:DUF262 domain-containing protein [Desertibacillus haloalkaliphilus]MBU8907669.1 DUF262 domain-containing HNH endonuclease family protein [Desertibacillus haloalkaliphilus]